MRRPSGTLRATVDGVAVDLDTFNVGTDCVDASVGGTCDGNILVNQVTASGNLAGVSITGIGAVKAGCVNCLMDLNGLAVSSSGAHTVDIFLSDIGFNTTGGFKLFFSATVPEGASATATLFGGQSNTLFDLNPAGGLGVIGPFFSPGNASLGSAAAASVNPYSLTERIRIVFGAGGGTFSGDFNVSAVPEPTSIVLLGSMLLGLGTAIRRKMIASKIV